MLKNIFSRDELLGFYRKQAQNKIAKSVKKKDLQEALDEGWLIERKNINTVRVSKEKRRSVLLESRVWTLLYRMGFEYISGEGGAEQVISPEDKASPKDQLDVVAIDNEIALCIECKSYESPKKDPKFPEKIARHSERRKRFARSVNSQYESKQKRHVATIIFSWDLIYRETDQMRANEANVLLFDEHDLEYFEALVKHLGQAAKYQFLAEVFRGKRIAGLQIILPALKTKMGGFTCYTFSIVPEYLLKIGYVAHRAKGKAIDVDAYQRMIKKSRLKRIAKYISKDGIFPTNIVINVEHKRHIQFNRGKQEGQKAGGMFGWLTLSPSYGSAWIIDGQHRLFAYSGHSRSNNSYLNVLAFEGLPPHKHAQLFVDINSEQKSVKRSLLVELDATLKWDSEEDEKRIDAIISKIGMALDEDKESPLKGRVLPSDAKKTHLRCITLTSFTSALRKTGFFIISKKKGITEYGALWRTDSSKTLNRSIFVIKNWFLEIANSTTEWWNLGAGDGGGLAMNNGITVCINVLRSILDYLGKTHNLLMLDNDDLVELLTPYAKALGDFFANMPQNDRLSFRQLQGADGQATGTRWCQQALHEKFPKFQAPGLDDWIERQRLNTNDQARKIIDYIEATLQDTLLNALKKEFNEHENHWWFEGIPKTIRKKVDERINESDGKAGKREQNFDLIHYREIIKHNWQLFGETFGYGKGNKEKRTTWITEVGTMRNTVMHISRREYLSIPKLEKLKIYEDWLNKQNACFVTGQVSEPFD